MRAAARALASAEAYLRACKLQAAAAAAEAGLRALPSNAPPSCHRLLLNAQGLALHLQGDNEAANDALQGALHAAKVAATAGDGDDSYVDIGGVLSDLAAKHAALGDLDAADAALKRGAYMLSRAYRPSAAAKACLLNVRGCLFSVRGDDAAALSAHEEAFALLCATPSAPSPPRPSPHSSGATSDDTIPVHDDLLPSWEAACRAGVAWAMLRTGGTAGAEAIATSAMRTHGSRMDAREEVYGRGLAAVAVLQRLQDGGSSGREGAIDGVRGGTAPGGRRRPDDECQRAVAALEGVASSLEGMLGGEHAL